MKAEKFKLNKSLTNSGSNILSIRDKISGFNGVNAVRVDTVTDTITVDYDESKISSADLNQQINNLK